MRARWQIACRWVYWYRHWRKAAWARTGAARMALAHERIHREG